MKLKGIWIKCKNSVTSFCICLPHIRCLNCTCPIISSTMFSWSSVSLFPNSITFNPSCHNPGRREKINFYFHTFCGKTFWGTTKKCENKKFNLIFISIQLSEMHGTLRVDIPSTFHIIFFIRQIQLLINVLNI